LHNSLKNIMLVYKCKRFIMSGINIDSGGEFFSLLSDGGGDFLA